MKLFKYISKVGVCSRRKSVDLIKNSSIVINGKTEKDPFYEVSSSDSVFYNGLKLNLEPYVYILLNKPKKYISTTSDEMGRDTVLDLVEISKKQRIYPVGRLDYMTTGLLLLTNDGDFANKMTHPRYLVKKGYYVSLNKKISIKDKNRLISGISLEDGFIKPDKIVFCKSNSVKIFIHSGKNRIIRRIFISLGYNVLSLDRFYYGGLTKGALKLGQWRYLKKSEIEKLQDNQ